MQALEEGPKGPVELRRSVGSPPQSTLRVYLRELVGIGVVERLRREGFPPTVQYVLTQAGRELLQTGQMVQEWLSLAPEGPLELGSPPAKSVVRALVEGWSTNIVRAVAARPYSLTELSRLNIKTSYPALERRLSAMRFANQVEPQPGEGRGVPYGPTRWLRRAVVPLAAGASWEQRHLVDSGVRVGRLDVEAAFLLAVPLIEVSPDANGRCRLSVEVQGGPAPAFAGVMLGIAEGRVLSCSVRLGGESEASVAGTPTAWLRHLSGRNHSELDLGRDAQLAEAVLEALLALGARARPQEQPAA